MLLQLVSISPSSLGVSSKVSCLIQSPYQEKKKKKKKKKREREREEKSIASFCLPTEGVERLISFANRTNINCKIVNESQYALKINEELLCPF